jgi:hypothetical protein
MWVVEVAETVVIIGTQSRKELSIAGLSFATGHCFAGLSWPLKPSFLTDATINQYDVGEGLSLKSKV